MKDTFVELAHYQKWANDRFRNNLKELDYSKLMIETPYGPIRDVIAHIFGAVELWMKRLQGESPKSIRTGESYNDWQNLEIDWLEMDNKLIELAESLNEQEFSKRIRYTSTEGLDLETSMDNVLIQLLTHHQSYHRGQIGMALRQNHLPPVQETDYIYYIYDQKKN